MTIVEVETLKYRVLSADGRILADNVENYTLASKVLENLGSLAEGARIVPIREDGKQVLLG